MRFLADQIAIGKPAPAAEADPLSALAARWDELEESYCAVCREDEDNNPRLDEIAAAQDAVERAILATPAVNLLGLAVKLHVACKSVDGSPAALMDDYRELAELTPADLLARMYRGERGDMTGRPAGREAPENWFRRGTDFQATDPLSALERDWQAKLAECRAVEARAARIHKTLPADAHLMAAADWRALAERTGLAALDAEDERLSDQLFAIEENIWQTQATSLAGAAVKLRLCLHYEQPSDHEAPEAACRRLAAALADLEQLAGDGTGTTVPDNPGSPAHAASPDAEIATLYAEYTAGRERASELDRSSPGKSSEETDRIYTTVYMLDERCDEIGERIAHLHAVTLQGLALKLRIVFGMTGYRSDDPGFRKLEPCKRAVALGLWTAIADAERLAGSAS